MPPPYNHNYQFKPLTEQEINREPFLKYGFVSGGSINVESTNVSTSHTDQSHSQSKQEAEGCVSEN